jgi:hypothetical protein
LFKGAMTFAAWTVLGTALLSVVCLEELLTQWTGGKRAWLPPIAGCLFIVGALSIRWQYEGIYSVFATPAHDFWAWSLVVLGAFAGLSWVPWSRIK